MGLPREKAGGSMTQKTEAMVLREAAAVLERDGWVQGTLHKHGGGHCAMGAIHEALGQPLLANVSCVTWFTPAYHEMTALQNRLCKMVGIPPSPEGGKIAPYNWPFTTWNDL